MPLTLAGWKKLTVETASSWSARDATSRSAPLAVFATHPKEVTAERGAVELPPAAPEDPLPAR